jgi:hypothetical protein
MKTNMREFQDWLYQRTACPHMISNMSLPCDGCSQSIYRNAVHHYGYLSYCHHCKMQELKDNNPNNHHNTYELDEENMLWMHISSSCATCGNTGPPYECFLIKGIPYCKSCSGRPTQPSRIALTDHELDYIDIWESSNMSINPDSKRKLKHGTKTWQQCQSKYSQLMIKKQSL